MKKLSCIKKLAGIFLLCCLSMTIFNLLQGIRPSMQNQLSVLTDDNRVKPQVLELLKLTNITDDGTLSSIVQATQKKQSDGGWIRASGAERWQIDEHQNFVNQRELMLSLFRQLNMIESINPSRKDYKYLLWFGATTERVRTRLADIVKEWNNGTRAEILVLFSGERDLDPNLENAAILY